MQNGSSIAALCKVNIMHSWITAITTKIVSSYKVINYGIEFEGECYYRFGRGDD